MLTRLKPRRALLADTRRGGRAELLVVQGFRRHEPEAHGIQHRAKVFALDSQAAGQITGQQGGRLAGQMPQFASDAFRHIKP